ncbi:MAG TPA: hypothetical protein EYP03_04075 [Aquificae bacterium]|nr:hypothetical protein [Aquificota bacterium]
MRVDVEAVQEDLRKAGLVLLAAAIIEHFIKGAGLNLTVVLSGIVMWIAGVIKFTHNEENKS